MEVERLLNDMLYRVLRKYDQEFVVRIVTVLVSFLSLYADSNYYIKKKIHFVSHF